MFTGLVECIGEVVSLKASPTKKSSVLTVKLPKKSSLSDAKLGDSIAVNGCCLTITKFAKGQMSFDVSFETMSLTNLGRLKSKNLVNLEGAMKVGDRLGGHIVSGHIDGLAELVELKQDKDGSTLWLNVPAPLARYVITK